MSDEYSVGGWHLRKEITIGQIVTMVTVIVAVITWGTSVESRLLVLEKSNQTLEKRLDRDFADLKRTLYRIESKIDQKADKK